MTNRKLVLGVVLWAGLATTAACMVEPGEEPLHDENVGEAQFALQDYGESCNPFNNACQPWLDCCGPFPHWEQYTCRCGPNCSACGTGTFCRAGECDAVSSRCCPFGYKFCDSVPYGCIPNGSLCSCVGK